MEPNSTRLQVLGIKHNGVAHYPLGAASYYFRDGFVKWLLSQAPSERINLFLGTQPNSMPHLGNLVNICVAFALGSRLAKEGRHVRVYLDYVDTAPAPGKDESIKGTVYTRSLRWMGAAAQHEDDFQEVLETLSDCAQVKFTTRTQSELLRDPRTVDALRSVIQHRTKLGELLSPNNGSIGIRAPCPAFGSCGLADKAGIHNVYGNNKIDFHCPHHGQHSVHLDCPDEVARLELNTPLRNLLRNQTFRHDDKADWIQVIGADYAGFYQEQFLWRPLGEIFGPCDRHPIILYSPQILDWSGAKLSKSLYVRGDAYKYLEEAGFEWVLSYALFKASGRTLANLFAVCMGWIDQPIGLFRDHTIYHMDMLLKEVDKDKQCTVGCDRGPSVSNREVAISMKQYEQTLPSISTEPDASPTPAGFGFHMNSAASDWITEDQRKT